jgi:hypothetical protein
LRRRALDSLPRSGGLGLTLFLDQGMYSWMRICANEAQPPAAAEPLPRAPHEIESEVVLILASMAMHSPHPIQEPA